MSDQKNAIPEPNEKARPNLFAWLRGRFFAGVVIAAPITITIWLIHSVVTFIDGQIKPFIPPAWNPESYLPFAIPGLGLLVAFITLVILGAVTTNLIGRSFLSLGERIVARLPLVSNIYNTLKQIFETVMAGNKTTFEQVVLVEYPRAGSWAVGFVSAQASGVVAKGLSDQHVGVFVPTTPNPTSGFLIYVLRNELKVLDISVEEGAKLIVSAGLLTPEVNGVIDSDPDMQTRLDKP